MLYAETDYIKLYRFIRPTKKRSCSRHNTTKETLSYQIMRKTIVLLLLPFSLAAQQADILIKNGKILDGTGNSWHYGDIAVQGGKIVAMGQLSKWTAVKTLDVTGLIVAPGFIDVHTHIEGDERRQPTADNFIYDGVTSVVTGNCGGSQVNMAKYFSMLDSLKISVNVASLIGHNDVRKTVMGSVSRDPTEEEMKKMEVIVEQAMKDGAVG